ncbi:DUF3373 family protein [Sulfurimonas sp. HSL-1656]|uniref:DUF3373 family protein n=1 Tax=Thiomicrolovo subterrani TaxID=3131934 RepID=UPI0031F7F4A2
MRKTLLSTAVLSLFAGALAADDASMQAEIDALMQKVQKLEQQQKRTNKKLSQVNAQSANDNVKFGLDFRNAVDVIDYRNNDADTYATNPSLLTSRLYLTMGAAPTEGLTFQGKLAVYSTWGSHLYVTDPALKDWAASSKASDTVMRIKEAYFVYSDELGGQPVSVSVGRRPSTNGFLANYRENEADPGSPLAHITNMEVNGAMVRLDWSRFIDGAYTKFVFGRAHSGEMQDVYGDVSGARMPYALSGGDVNTTLEDTSVDFFVMPGNAYDDGQYHVMYQWAHIFNTKGMKLDGNIPKAASGSADLFSVGLKVSGIGEEISDFLDETTLFVSGAYTHYDAKNGYTLLGSADGGSRSGSSVWAGIIIPDMLTERGRLGFEYNHGSKYWTPMNWAEDTAIGSKLAVRGNAYEAYWNFDLFGVKYLPSQIRYTYVQHDYTPNINCAGWVAPVKTDITATDLRLAVTYRY